MAELNKKFIVNLKGKDFVEYGGLIDLAHQLKLKSIKTDIVQFPNKENNNQCIVKAIIATEDEKVFEGYGDADPSNVNSMIARHLIRMAETRAKARALRDLTNVGMTAIEELGGDEEPKKQNKDHQALKDNSLATDSQLPLIGKLMKDKNYSAESMVSYIDKMYNKKSSKDLTRQEASALIEMLNGM